MDELIAFVKKFEVLLTSVVTIIPLTFVFRRQLGELGELLDSVLNPAQHRWKVEFGKQVRQEQKKQQNTGLTVPAPAGDGVKLRGRDMVLEAWAAVKQAVYDGCIANRIVPAPRVLEAVRQLRGARELSTDLVALVEFLYDRGLQVAGDSGKRPQEDDAVGYRSLAQIAVFMLGQSALIPLPLPLPPLPPMPPPRRATQVGGSFVQMSPGGPGAALVAVVGPMKGRQYAVDKSTYRVGRDADNDLCATADDSISGHHARLRYQNGGLYLDDQGSRNGTFLNEQRVTGAPVMVRPGDRIRLGESVFEVVGTPAGSPSSGAKDDGNKGPGRSVVF